MTHSEFLAVLERRAGAGGAAVSPDLAGRLWAYFQLLAHWNSKVNLTGFVLDSPTDAAIDRLFIEPLVAAAAVDSRSQALIDIGSGGGSPGIPMSLALSPDRTVLVEARARKGVFLKEVTRVLGLSHRVEVRTARFEDLAASDEFSGVFDTVTVRAVRLDDEDLATLTSFLKPRGQLVFFGSESERPPQGLCLSMGGQRFAVVVEKD